MKKNKKTKLAEARDKAFAGRASIKRKEFREFEGDVLKHYIRVHCWMPRIKKLLHARGIKSIRYLSLCASTAFDARLFGREGLIDFLKDKPIPFVYCESEKESFEILRDTFKNSSMGFYGKIEEIATSPDNHYYGDFWSTFPIDVINLDFWGDIHKAKDIVKNIFYAIQVIISCQALLREPYELWITWRAKPDRIANNIEYAYLELIDLNQGENQKFAGNFTSAFPNTPSSALDVEDLVRIGFIKWILYITNREFSVVDKDNTEVLVYSRKDKDGKTFRMYNFLIRIKPYETITIPSPACEAARFCGKRYQSNLSLCFIKPRDIDQEYRRLPSPKKKGIQSDLDKLSEEYERDISGILK